MAQIMLVPTATIVVRFITGKQLIIHALNLFSNVQVASEAVLLSLEIIGIVGVTVSLVAMAITILTFICLR